MNEKIKELAKEAGFNQMGIWNIIGIDEYNERFAELIVRKCIDCIDIMEKIANSTNASIPKDYDKHTYLKTLDSLKGLLKVHFGLEE